MLADEPDDATGERPAWFAGGDEVGEHGADLDAAQLVGIADEDEPAVVGHGGEQSGRQRQGEHRRLVDDDEVGASGLSAS